MKNYLKYFLSLLLFSSNGVVASHIALTSYETVFWRISVGTAVILALYLASGNRFSCAAHKKDYALIILSGMAMGASWLFIYEAYDQVGVSIASLIYYCGPVIVMALSPLLFRERLTAEKVLGFVIVLTGLFFVNGKLSGQSLNLWGAACGLLGASTYAIMVILNKKTAQVKGFENVVVQLFGGLLLIAAFFGLKTGFHVQVQGSDWPWILMLGVLNTGLGCYCYFTALGRLPVQTVAICGYLEPLSAVLLAVLLLHEALLPLQTIGAALIIGGALIGECLHLKKQRPPHADQEERHGQNATAKAEAAVSAAHLAGAD